MSGGAPDGSDEDGICQYRNSYFTYKNVEWEYVWINAYDGFNRDG
jgi:hypothetical protein